MGLASLKDERGMVLVTSLALLLILTLLGIAAIQTTTLEERMAGSIADKNLAFQAAEAALRDAEREIDLETRFPNASAQPPGTAAGTVRDILIAAGPFNAACANGLCYNTAALSAADWRAAKLVMLRDGTGTNYGSQTGRAALPGVVASRYLIDFECLVPAGESEPVYVFTLTALGVGARATTEVILEGSYRVK